MENEILIKALVMSLFEVNELHQEYQDNDIHFVVDTQRDGKELTVKITLIEEEDKQEFEKWLEKIDNELFSEVIDEIKKEDSLIDLDSLYNSKDYKKVIDKVKSKTQEVIENRIEELKSLLNESSK